ncbi:MAG: YraN family protein [Lachnospiraceae bacterium]|nr:YraN family protein [Lachnospiraceae bacterium]
MNTRKKGEEYECVAAKYLQSHSVEILERNYRNYKGEIDIIGKDGEYTVFFEVKYRKDNSRGYPGEAVNYGKQKTICRVADYYRMIHHMGEFTPVRYDVVAICGEEITWYKNAFEHIY